MTEKRQPPGTMITEAASLIYLIGGMAPKHLVVVGGLLPPLLVPDAAVQHRGSADIDLALSVAFTKGETAEYYQSVEAAIEPYFEPVAGFRWAKRDGAPGVGLLVDFLGPEVEATLVADGTLALENEIAVRNTGPVVTPFPLECAQLIEADAVQRRIDGVELVYQEGMRANVTIRHAGPVGFLASKADAMCSRSEHKDAYDVAWWCMQSSADREAVAALVTARPAFRDPYFLDSVSKLSEAFEARDYPGPTGYAEEMRRGMPGDDAYERDRNDAFLAVSAVLDLLFAELGVERQVG